MVRDIRFLDACMPCYFQGFSGVVLAVPCFAGMTWNDVREGIEEDSNAADHGLDDWAGFDSAMDSMFAHVGDMDSRVDFIDHD